MDTNKMELLEEIDDIDDIEDSPGLEMDIEEYIQLCFERIEFKPEEWVGSKVCLKIRGGEYANSKGTETDTDNVRIDTQWIYAQVESVGIYPNQLNHRLDIDIVLVGNGTLTIRTEDDTELNIIWLGITAYDDIYDVWPWGEPGQYRPAIEMQCSYETDTEYYIWKSSLYNIPVSLVRV